LVIGGGHQRAHIVESVAARGVSWAFRFVSYQDHGLLKYSLGVPDVHWISLRPDLEGLIVPSKFFGIAAAGRPVIAITAEDGDVARLVRRHACGLVIVPGNGDVLADALIRLSADAEATRAMGRRARAMLDAQFKRQQAFARWRDVLERVDMHLSDV